ncbi:unnamed protein product [Auanema sp. JU1783]|nr:unnamed protein product [Auanema sp. JU1783]
MAEYSKPMGNDFCHGIGDTPLIELKTITKGLPARIAVKLEYLNPTGSVKDRPARNIVHEAEKRGELIPGKHVLLEGTSGNTGIALAAISAAKGYKCVLVMPASMSIERRSLLSAYGAQLVLTDPADGFKGVMTRLEELTSVIPNVFRTNQFSNMDNPKAHYNSTGPEIWKQTDGKVDIVCFGVGTGGTISGVSRFLKEKNPLIQSFAIEPTESAVLSGGPAGKHKIQGIGAGLIPDTLDTTIYDGVIAIASDDALAMARRIAVEEGILAGISSGSNVLAAIELAKRPGNEGKLIVTTVNSSGERYLSSELYSQVNEEAAKAEIMSTATSIDIVNRYLAQE